MTGFGPITQLGYLTDDINAAVKAWVAAGVGPWTRMTGVTMPATMDGKSVEIKIDLALSYHGDIQMELIQPICDSPSPYLANAKAGIWGAHHTQFTVNNLDEAIAACQSVGMELACEITSGGGRYIYMRGEAGWIELVEPNAGLQIMFDMIKMSCVDWDGQSPWNQLG